MQSYRFRLARFTKGRLLWNHEPRTLPTVACMRRHEARVGLAGVKATFAVE